ncbi:hypothetical protein CR513_39279, partial [Mucuna pruriens]
MYISGGNDRLSYRLFPGTLRGVAMHWMATLPARSIRTFNDLAGLFLSQFAANKTKRMEVADLFDIKQSRGESLKGKERSFVWTLECEEAFLCLKAILATPPVLVRLVSGAPLYVYISVSDAAISTILIQERDGEQRPVLRKPDLAGRMVAWSVQLSEFDISFERRGHIKAQALADFIIELTPPAEPTIGRDWYLSVDGSSNHAGRGAGIILERPDGILIKQSLHFEFRASNNQEEYEALLVGMKLA